MKSPNSNENKNSGGQKFKDRQPGERRNRIKSDSPKNTQKFSTGDEGRSSTPRGFKPRDNSRSTSNFSNSKSNRAGYRDENQSGSRNEGRSFPRGENRSGTRNEPKSGFRNEGGFRKDAAGGFGREGRPASTRGNFSRGDSNSGRAYKSEDRSSRPSENRPQRFSNNSRSENQPRGEGGYRNDRGFNNEGGYRKEGSYRKEGGGYRSEGGFRKEGGYRKEGGSNKDNGFNKPGGYRKEGGFNNEGGYRKESGFRKEGGYRSEGGFRKDNGFRKEGGFNREGNSPNPRRNNSERPTSRGFNKPENTDSPSRGFAKNKSSKKKDNFQETPKGYKGSRRTLGKVQQQQEQSLLAGEDLVRLNRYIANSGICSRREADELITQGLVKVNGEVVTELGTKVRPHDTVKVEDKKVTPEKPIYILLNKPKGYITSTADPEGRQTVLDLIDLPGKERIYPVGRLDRNTTGVLLLTNDGELSQKLMHPSFEIKKIYRATLDKRPTKEHMLAWVEGVELEDGWMTFEQIGWVEEGEENVLGVEIKSGRNRIVRRMFEHFGYEVTSLDRAMLGEFDKLKLGRGKWRFLTEKEMKYIERIKRMH